MKTSAKQKELRSSTAEDSPALFLLVGLLHGMMSFLISIFLIFHCGKQYY